MLRVAQDKEGPYGSGLGGGHSGSRLGVSELLQPGRYPNLTVPLDETLAADATLWVRIWVDYDEDGGDPVETSFAVTVATG